MISSIGNSLGYGSGIDLAKLVADLAAASRDPKVARIDGRAKAVQSSISAVAQARADLEGFSTSLAALVAGGTLQSQPSVSDPTIVDAKATAGTAIANVSGEIEVTRLARGQSVVAAAVANAAAPVGQGTFTLTIGATAYPIVIGSANDSTTGLAAAINASASGVTAIVVSDPAGARLVLKGPPGSASAFTLTGGPFGAGTFTYPGAMTLLQSAVNAAFTVDGLAYSRPGNTVDDVLPGVTLTLKKIAPGAPVAIGVVRADDTLKATLTDFVGVFNTLKAHIADARTATRGDQALRTLDRQLAQLMAQPVTSGRPASLSAIGVKTNRDGTISFDATAFAVAYARDPGAVEAIFSPVRDATHSSVTDPGIGGALAALKTATTAANGAFASLSTRLGREAAALAVDRTRIETRETAYKARLEKQFGGTDSRIGALKATQSYLDQQIKLWTASR